MVHGVSSEPRAARENALEREMNVVCPWSVALPKRYAYHAEWAVTSTFHSRGGGI
jgi:hypothetical protein